MSLWRKVCLLVDNFRLVLYGVRLHLDVALQARKVVEKIVIELESVLSLLPKPQLYELLHFSFMLELGFVLLL